MLPKKQVTVELPAQIAELADCLKGFLLACDKALSDGFQPGQDLPAIISAAVQGMIPAMQAVKGAGEELKADPFGVGKVAALLAADVLEVFLAKEVSTDPVSNVEQPKV